MTNMLFKIKDVSKMFTIDSQAKLLFILLAFLLICSFYAH